MKGYGITICSKVWKPTTTRMHRDPDRSWQRSCPLSVLKQETIRQPASKKPSRFTTKQDTKICFFKHLMIIFQFDQHFLLLHWFSFFPKYGGHFLFTNFFSIKAQQWTKICFWKHYCKKNVETESRCLLDQNCIIASSGRLLLENEQGALGAGKINCKTLFLCKALCT